MKFTFYLFNESVTEFDKAIKATKLNGDFPFYPLTPNRELPFEYRAYYQQNKPTLPKWYSYLIDAFEFDDDMMNQTNSFLLLIKVSHRIFAITMGFGFTAINRDYLERGFGLKVVLNEIDPAKIKSVDARRIDTTTKQKRVLVSKSSELYNFEFDRDEEMLSMISGVPSDVEFANKLAGADSLSLTCNIPVDDLGQKCEQLLASFYKENYKEFFGFIDNLRVVKVPSLCKELDDSLARALEDRVRTKLMVAYPEIDSPSRVDEYYISTTSKRVLSVTELDIEAIYTFLDKYHEKPIPKRVFIQGFDSDSQAITERYNLKDYLVFETELNEKRYIFTLNTWFEVDADFDAEVSHYIEQIHEIPNSDGSYLPPIKLGLHEDKYNEMVANQLGYLLLHKKEYYPGGGSRVEVCDLYTQEGHLICVKKYNGSSTLSHLFSQGLVSAQCLFDDSEYRVFIHSQIPEGWEDLINENDFERTMIRIVFAIACAKEGSLADSLPFFSKVNLRYACRAFERLGISVSLCKIDFIDS